MLGTQTGKPFQGSHSVRKATSVNLHQSWLPKVETGDGESISEARYSALFVFPILCGNSQGQRQQHPVISPPVPWSPSTSQTGARASLARALSLENCHLSLTLSIATSFFLEYHSFPKPVSFPREKKKKQAPANPIHSIV